MREFRDDQGRPWQVHLTSAVAMRIKQNVTVEVDGKPVPFNIIDFGMIGVTLQVLRGNYITIAETLYEILCRQIEEKGLTKEQFFDGLRGDAIDAAANVLEQELIDFFPPRRRKPAKLLALKMNEMDEEATERAVANLETFGQSSMRQQESSESTLESGPLESLSQPATAV